MLPEITALAHMSSADQVLAVMALTLIRSHGFRERYDAALKRVQDDQANEDRWLTEQEATLFAPDLSKENDPAYFLQYA